MDSNLLVKAQLMAVEQGNSDITFMFNPRKLKFKTRSKFDDESSARDSTGTPKVSYLRREPYTLSIDEIYLDTYETGESVMTYIEQFEETIKFAKGGPGQDKRPPIYIFVWGQNKYIRCIVESLDYNLTMFLPDGTPVRAEVDLELKEVDEQTTKPDMQTGSIVPRKGASRDDLLGKKKNKTDLISGLSNLI